MRSSRLKTSKIEEFWLLIPTAVYFIVGCLMFGAVILVIEMLTPFSIRKELEEDQNVAIAVLMGSGLIALSIVLAAAIAS